jgi:hypothetical protein
MENKLVIKDLKSQIKVLASQQRELKNQRKTVHVVGERTMEPWKAWIQHQSNRSKLRDLYLVYGILRGKKLEDIDKTYPYKSETYINKLIEQHGGEIIHNS